MRYTIILSILTLASCNTEHSSIKTTREMPIVGSVIQVPVLVDLVVLPKDSMTVNKIYYPNLPSEGVINTKNESMVQLLKKDKADIVLNPIYDIEINNNKLSVTVIGYPAQYKNFRSAKPSDTATISIYKYVPYNTVVNEGSMFNIIPNPNKK